MSFYYAFPTVHLTGDDKKIEVRCSNLIARRSGEEDRASVAMRFGAMTPSNRMTILPLARIISWDTDPE